MHVDASASASSTQHACFADVMARCGTKLQGVVWEMSSDIVHCCRKQRTYQGNRQLAKFCLTKSLLEIDICGAEGSENAFDGLGFYLVNTQSLRAQIQALQQPLAVPSRPCIQAINVRR